MVVSDGDCAGYLCATLEEDIALGLKEEEEML